MRSLIAILVFSSAGLCQCLKVDPVRPLLGVFPGTEPQTVVTLTNCDTEDYTVSWQGLVRLSPLPSYAKFRPRHFAPFILPAGESRRVTLGELAIDDDAPVGDSWSLWMDLGIGFSGSKRREFPITYSVFVRMPPEPL